MGIVKKKKIVVAREDGWQRAWRNSRAVKPFRVILKGGYISLYICLKP